MRVNIQFNNYIATFNLVNSNNTTVLARITNWPVVNDQIRGYYTFNNGWIPTSTSKKFKKLALIVESPHKDEFDLVFNPIAPLNGASGKKFSKFITNRLNKWFPNGLNNYDIEIKIINPIQYQASLYHFLNGMIPYNNQGNYSYTSINKQLRDFVWRFLFNQCNLKTNFTNRMKRYNCHYVINCCTGKSYYKTIGTLKPTLSQKNLTVLKSIVRNELCKNGIINKNNYIEDAHPINWR